MAANRKSLTLVVLAAVALGTIPAIADHEDAALVGLVTNLGGEGIADVCVAAHGEYVEVPEEEDYQESFETRTEPDGTYVLLVVGGTYRVHFSDCGYYEEVDGPRYLSEWFDDKTSFEEADVVIVESGADTTGIDASLAEGGSISGTVTDAGGEPLGYVCVDVSGGQQGRNSYTSLDGTYRIGGLRTGNYKVSFYGCDEPILDEGMPLSSASQDDGEGYSGSPYVGEWFNDKATHEEADLVPVVAGVETPGIDAELVIGGSISGIVTDQEGDPLTACVEAFSLGGAFGGYARAASTGVYVVQGLRGGDYKVQFSDCYRYRHQSEWYEDAPTLGSADPISVVLGVETLDIDAALAIRPVPDLAITDLSVRNVPLETDIGPVASAGWNRKVQVELSNLGSFRSSYAELQVWVRTVSDDSWYRLGAEDFHLVDAGEVLTRSYRWSGLGIVGDVEVRASICTFYGEDANIRNNTASVDHYVMVGGTGIGLGLRRDDGRPHDCTFLGSTVRGRGPADTRGIEAVLERECARTIVVPVLGPVCLPA